MRKIENRAKQKLSLKAGLVLIMSLLISMSSVAQIDDIIPEKDACDCRFNQGVLKYEDMSDDKCKRILTQTAIWYCFWKCEEGLGREDLANYYYSEFLNQRYYVRKNECGMEAEWSQE